MTTVRIDTAALVRRMGVAPKKIQRVNRNALNDAARELRAATPAIMKRAVDRPVPFTARASAVLYKSASYTDLSASLRFAPIQARYLNPSEFGQRTGRIHTPIARDAIDPAGNLKRRFRWTPAERARLLAQSHSVRSQRTGGTRTIGKYFFGKPHGGYRMAGLFERPKDPRKPLRRITIIAKRRRYNATFGIRREWQRLGGPMLERHLATQSARPENRI